MLWLVDFNNQQNLLFKLIKSFKDSVLYHTLINLSILHNNVPMRIFAIFLTHNFKLCLNSPHSVSCLPHSRTCPHSRCVTQNTLALRPTTHEIIPHTRATITTHPLELLFRHPQILYRLWNSASKKPFLSDPCLKFAEYQSIVRSPYWV